MHIRSIFFSLSFLLLLSVAGSASANTQTLLDRVNEALRAAGLPVTEQTQQAYAKGVVSGHYTSFEQLVNAMKWHKVHGKTLPNTAAFRKVWVFTGTVTEVNAHRLETVGVTKQGIEVHPKFRLTKNTRLKNGSLLFKESEQTLHDVLEEIRRGSVVTVIATTSNEALVIINMTPKGQADYYGPVDCTKCGVSTQNIDKKGQEQEAPPEEQEEGQG